MPGGSKYWARTAGAGSRRPVTGVWGSLVVLDDFGDLSSYQEAVRQFSSLACILSIWHRWLEARLSRPGSPKVSRHGAMAEGHHRSESPLSTAPQFP